MEPYEYRNYYLKKDILISLFENSRNKEIVPVFYSSKYGKRPNYAQYRGDIINWIKQGASSFHISVENWKNPFAISSNVFEMNKNRISWDIIFDIDADKGIEFAKIAAILLIDEIKKHKIKNIYAKFSGNRGFHIGLSHKTMPEYIGEKKTKLMYPELLVKTAHYLKEQIREKLKEQFEKLLNSNVENPYDYVDIEENWSYRHLFRMPYSLNEKTYLAGIILDIDKIKFFRKTDANPENVREIKEFLTKGDVCECKNLLMRAKDSFDFLKEKQIKRNAKQFYFEKQKLQDELKNNLEAKIKKLPVEKRKEYRDAIMDYGKIIFQKKTKKIQIQSREKKINLVYKIFIGEIPGIKETKHILENKKIIFLFIPNELKEKIKSSKYYNTKLKININNFPPCIKTMLEGLEDGKKRAVFILINFLSCCVWEKEKIKQLLLEWNEKNKEPLKKNYILSQLNYAKTGDETIPPPDCNKPGYYKDMGVCNKDDFCLKRNITNPISYAKLKNNILSGSKEKRKKAKFI
ncbi:MAG: hypothetical protein B6U87_00860 [Candidatus Aenigmarchaeota archaeon ex4484_52]|nr:MAG: hypothetical protein B6U87_00860 [Candidatus Aenigmarchaeota archaeon ex4484_52]